MKKVIQENNLKAIKYKFYIPGKHYYGCGVIVYDIVKNRIENYASVISLNPSVYEINLSLSIEEIEKIIYKYKLEKGALYEVSKKLFFKICEDEKKIISSIKNEKIGELIETIFKTLNMSSYNEEKIKFIYKLSDYIKNVEDKKEFNSLNEVIDNLHEKKFFIKTKPVIDMKQGVLAEKIKLKKNIECFLTDTRDVVKYIIKLLYGTKEKTIVGKVVDITKKNNDYFEIILSITPIIFTKIILHKLQKVKML